MSEYLKVHLQHGLHLLDFQSYKFITVLCLNISQTKNHRIKQKCGFIGYTAFQNQFYDTVIFTGSKLIVCKSLNRIYSIYNKYGYRRTDNIITFLSITGMSDYFKPA